MTMVESIPVLGGPPAASNPAVSRFQDVPRRSPLKKSESAVSSGGQSVRSYISVPVTGTFPLGSLQVHQPSPESASLLSRELLMKPLPETPADESLAAVGGDVLLMLDLPSPFTVGYDSVSFHTRNFQGVRGIPPGAHFFWVSRSDATTTRSGTWIVSSAAGTESESINVVQWDKFNEVLGEPASQTEARIQKENIGSVYSKLTPYDNPSPNSQSTEPDALAELGEGGVWPKLTSCISPAVLNRISGRTEGPWPAHTTDRVKGAVILPAELELDKRLMSVVAVMELNFTFSQTARTYNTETIGEERTQHATDATPHITSLIDDPSSPITEDSIVGELQYAFIVGMHLGNESCIQQWWHMLLTLILRAYHLPLYRPRLARLLLQTITAQLDYDDRLLDGSILDFGPSDHARDLRLALIVYKRRLNELLLGLNNRASEEQAAVGRAFSDLEAQVWKFGWDIRSDYLRSGKIMLEDGEEVHVDMDELEGEDERGEFAATVVELDDAGRQKDLVSWN